MSQQQRTSQNLSSPWFQPSLDQASLDHVTYPVCWISHKIKTTLASLLFSGHISWDQPQGHFCHLLICWYVPWIGSVAQLWLLQENAHLCLAHSKGLRAVQSDPQTPFLIRKCPSLPSGCANGQPAWEALLEQLWQQLLALLVKLPTSKKTMGRGALNSKINPEKSRFKKLLCLYETKALLPSGPQWLVEKNHHVSRCLGIN